MTTLLLLGPAGLALVAVLLWPGPARLSAPRVRADERSTGGARPSVAPGSTSGGSAPPGSPVGPAPAASAPPASAPVHPAARLLRRRGRLDPAAIAEVVELVSAPLRAGSSPADAMAIAASVTAQSSPLRPLLDELAAAAAAGEHLGPIWSARAEHSGVPGLGLLATAWTLTEELGAPLSGSTAVVAGVLREQESAQRRLATATAGPRASMVLLTLLPLSGPAVGAVLGVAPADLYRGPAGASAAAGLALAALGWGWSRALLRRALRPEVHP